MIGQRQSLKWFFIISLALAVAVPVTIIGAITIKFTVDSVKNEIVLRNQLLVNNLAQQVEELQNNQLEVLESIKRVIDQDDTDQKTANEVLTAALESHRQFIKLQVVNEAGFVTNVTPYDEEFINIDMSRRLFFTETMKTGKPHWSNTFISPQLNQPVITLSIPLRKGILSAFVSLGALRNSINKISIGKDSFVAITDQTGTFIAHRDESKIFQRDFDPNYEDFKKNYSGGIITRQVVINGRNTMANAMFIRRTGWAIVVYQSMREMFAPIRYIYYYFIVGTGITLLIITLFSFKLFGSILNILRKFTASSRIISDGKYDHRIEQLHYTEFRDLADQFNAMAHSIKSREKSLIESEDKYRSIFIAAKDAIIVLDHETGGILNVNDSACELYGYTRDELLNLRNVNLSAEPDKTTAGLQAETNWIPLRYHIKKDGAVFPVEISINYHFTSNGQKISTAIIRDISTRISNEEEQKQMEEKLRQAQKMEAIGTLVGGISHDFNNLLQAITGYSQLLLMDKTEDAPEVSSLKAIHSSGSRASDLVRQLLLFSRKADTERKHLDLNRQVEQAQGILQRTIPKMIDIVLHLDGGLWNVNADHVQMEQILLNLGANAADAMPDGGTLVISTENAVLEESNTRSFPGVEPGRYVILIVSDTGHGMSRETIEKIFDPFFTTKDIGKGTGLGLASVYGIVKSHDGYITCNSEVDKGTTFKIHLPAIERDGASEAKEKMAKPPQGGEETILIVDDEESIRGFAVQALRKYGYTVLAASSGEEAMEIYSNHNNKIDMVIMDIGMPGMGGHRCLQEIMQVDPKAKVLIASGYSINGQVKKSLEAGAVGYVAKPYQLTDLLEMARTALDKKADSN